MKDVRAFVWPDDKDIKKFDFTYSPQLAYMKLMSKDVCLDGIGIGLNNGKESPICQYRKNDAKEVKKFIIDQSKDIATIRLKVWDRNTEP